MIGGKQIGGQRPGGRHQDGYGMTKSEGFFFFLTPDFAPTKWQLLCLRRGVHTHSVSHAHFSLHLFLAWRTDTNTHGSRCLQRACHISPSRPVHSHVSSAILAVPARSLRHLVPVCTFLAELLPIRKRGSSALPHERRGVWPGRSHALHRLWAPRFRQDYCCRWRPDAYQRSVLRKHLWLLENHTREHWTVRCSHKVRSLCFARFPWWNFSSGRRQRQHASGNRLPDRERERAWKYAPRTRRQAPQLFLHGYPWQPLTALLSARVQLWSCVCLIFLRDPPRAHVGHP